MTTKALFKCCICKNTNPGFHLGVLLEHIAVEHEEIALYQCSMCRAKFFTAAFASYHVKCNHKNKEGVIDTIDPTKVPLEKLKNVYEKYTASICPDHTRFSPCVKIDRVTQTDFVKTVPPAPRIIRSVVPPQTNPLIVNRELLEGNSRQLGRTNPEHNQFRPLLDLLVFPPASKPPMSQLTSTTVSQSTETTDIGNEFRGKPVEDNTTVRNPTDNGKFSKIVTPALPLTPPLSNSNIELFPLGPPVFPPTI